MKWSNLFLFTQKDAPADAEVPSHKLMMRAGMLKKVGPGIFTYQFLCLRAIRKFENIVRDELNALGCQEVLMPMVHPKSLWEETGRWEKMGDQLLKFQNRNEQWYCLAGTHEEAVTDLVRNDLKSYKHFPHNIYQIQTKYRDEIRPRFGLMRGREFIMKDAYSFDIDPKSALMAYDKMYAAYKNIFSRLKVDFRVVEADAGNIGGSQTHEFQLLAEAGEDHLMVCDSCEFAANVEIAPILTSAIESYSGGTGAKETFETPKVKTIAALSKFMNVEEKYLVKTLLYKTEKGENIAILTRGSDELNDIKLKNLLKDTNPPTMLSIEEVRSLTGASPGSCGPIGLTCKIFVDQSLKNYKNFCTGANKDDVHFKNVNFSDFKHEGFFDLRKANAGDPCPKCQAGKYKSFRGIEVGHCFYLGTGYSKAMNASFLDADGKNQPIEMGCYGIGISRTVQAVIEQCHDQDGIIWPTSISPFQVHICNLDPETPEVNDFANKLYADLQSKNVEVFMDDRKERPGVKFKDADLLGFPIRVTVGGKSLQENVVEMVIRKGKAQTKVATATCVSTILSTLQSL
jgi:prolyl-tRNA synthetase